MSKAYRIMVCDSVIAFCSGLSGRRGFIKSDTLSDLQDQKLAKKKRIRIKSSNIKSINRIKSFFIFCFFTLSKEIFSSSDRCWCFRSSLILIYNYCMNKKDKKERAYYVLKKMEELFPGAKSELINWETPFQFLVSIILSAQTTDAQVNKVTDKLFKKFPTPQLLMNARQEEVERLVKGINYYKTKSANIIKTSRKIVEEFKGKIPETVKELTTLYGVGNKTANVFLNDLYELNVGIGADTHIMRVSQRLGLSRNKTPDKIAKDLEQIYERKDWHRVNTVFVLYGRYYCKARVNPERSECIFKEGICNWCSK